MRHDLYCELIDEIIYLNNVIVSESLNFLLNLFRWSVTWMWLDLYWEFIDEIIDFSNVIVVGSLNCLRN